MDRRTHQRTDDAFLCPIKRIASLLLDRIYRMMPNAGPDTPINSTFVNGKSCQILSTRTLRKFIRSTCTAQGGKQRSYQILSTKASEIHPINVHRPRWKINIRIRRQQHQNQVYPIGSGDGTLPHERVRPEN